MSTTGAGGGGGRVLPSLGPDDMTLGSSSGTLSLPHHTASKASVLTVPASTMRSLVGRLPSSAKLEVNRAPLERNEMHIWLFQNLLSITQGLVSPPQGGGHKRVNERKTDHPKPSNLFWEGLHDLLAQTSLVLSPSESRKTSPKCAMGQRLLPVTTEQRAHLHRTEHGLCREGLAIVAGTPRA